MVYDLRVSAYTLQYYSK